MRLNAENARRTEVLDIGAVRSVRDVAARMRRARLCVSCPTDEERFAAHADRSCVASVMAAYSARRPPDGEAQSTRRRDRRPTRY